MSDGTAVTVEVHVESTPDAAYDAISDVTRMGQWSPETTACRWLGGASRPVVGARFRGSNRIRWRHWTTTCSIVTADPGARFTFDVVLGPLPMARWDYEFVATDDGCVVRETWTEHRPRWLRRVDPRIMGVPNRSEHARRTMEVTLERLARALARPSTSNP
jgi:hypothetical protein